MPGTIEGGKKAAETNKKRDPDFYRKIGAKGGQKGTTGGFAANRLLASIAGRKGGRKSRPRKPSEPRETEYQRIRRVEDERKQAQR
jgi:general stress protein YciG